MALGAYAFSTQWRFGLGVAGYEHPMLWGIYITNFVFWVGIAHSGTLISAVLFLFRAKWRTSVARASEAMTVFAVMTAALFPIIHIGRPWFFYWLIPYPNERQLWVNFQSPLVWDVFALTTYLTVSAMFLFLGLMPDVAAARDRSTDWRKPIYRVLALGWRGSTRQWIHYGPSTASRRPGDAARRVGPTASCRGTSRCPSCPDGTARSSRPTSWPGRSSRAWRW